MTFSNRFELIHLLGGKCSRCNEENMAKLEIDHIYNDGELDRASFNNVHKKWLGMPELAKKRLQVLCKSCHNEKDWEVRQKDHEKYKSQFLHKESKIQDKPKYELTNEIRDGIDYIIHRESAEIPSRMNCICNNKTFSLYALKKTGELFLFCNICEYTRSISLHEILTVKNI